VILSEAFDQDLTGDDERERVLTVARSPARNPARLRPGSGRRRCPGPSRGWGTSERGAAVHGDVECVVAVVDCFQNRRRGAAGDVQGGRSFGLTKRSSICCEIKPTEGFRGCARVKEREWAR
jgi:hypothetical protein